MSDISKISKIYDDFENGDTSLINHIKTIKDAKLSEHTVRAFLKRVRSYIDYSKDVVTIFEILGSLNLCDADLNCDKIIIEAPSNFDELVRVISESGSNVKELIIILFCILVHKNGDTLEDITRGYVTCVEMYDAFSADMLSETEMFKIKSYQNKEDCIEYIKAYSNLVITRKFPIVIMLYLFYPIDDTDRLMDLGVWLNGSYDIWSIWYQDNIFRLYNDDVNFCIQMINNKCVNRYTHSTIIVFLTIVCDCIVRELSAYLKRMGISTLPKSQSLDMREYNNDLLLRDYDDKDRDIDDIASKILCNIHGNKLLSPFMIVKNILGGNMKLAREFLSNYRKTICRYPELLYDRIPMEMWEIKKMEGIESFIFASVDTYDIQNMNDDAVLALLSYVSLTIKPDDYDVLTGSYMNAISDRKFNPNSMFNVLAAFLEATSFPIFTLFLLYEVNNTYSDSVNEYKCLNNQHNFNNDLITKSVLSMLNKKHKKDKQVIELLSFVLDHFDGSYNSYVNYEYLANNFALTSTKIYKPKVCMADNIFYLLSGKTGIDSEDLFWETCAEAYCEISRCEYDMLCEEHALTTLNYRMSFIVGIQNFVSTYKKLLVDCTIQSCINETNANQVLSNLFNNYAGLIMINDTQDISGKDALMNTTDMKNLIIMDIIRAFVFKDSVLVRMKKGIAAENVKCTESNYLKRIFNEFCNLLIT